MRIRKTAGKLGGPDLGGIDSGAGVGVQAGEVRVGSLHGLHGGGTVVHRLHNLRPHLKHDKVQNDKGETVKLNLHFYMVLDC